MKQHVLLALGLLVFLATSCESTPPAPPPNFLVSVTSEKDSGMMDFKVQWSWQTESLFTAGTGFRGFSITFTNRTDKIAKVVWEQSSLTYNGQSFAPFIEGQKYAESSRPMSPMIVPAKGTVVKEVFSSQQPYYVSGQYGGWRMRAITANDVSMLFCVQSGDTEDYYTVRLSLMQP